MKVGFTGTQKGMKDAQMLALQKLIRELTNEEYITEYHHGDCIGADEQFHQLISDPDKTFIHPPDVNKKRAWCFSNHVTEIKPYLDRNRDIVDVVDVLLATPRENYEMRRSGTWSTIRYARVKSRSIYIIYPSGNIHRDNYGRS